MASVFQAQWVTIRTYKRAVGNPSYVWANAYEVQFPVTAPEDSPSWTETLQAIMVAEAELHGANVEYVKAIASTWREGDTGRGGPYDPEAFIVAFPISSLVGQRALSGDPLPRHVALYAKKGVTSGFTGKLFFRGALSEVDLQATSALDARLTSAATTAIGELLDTYLESFNAAFGAYAGEMVMLDGYLSGAEPAHSRPVRTLTVGGVTVNQPNHAYFDRP